MAFYSEQRGNFLRFGDVVRGYVSTCPIIKGPVTSPAHINNGYKIDVEIAKYSVVVTPCCSIEDHMICLTPLIKLRKDFMKNPYFVEDFTIINREIEPQKCYPPDEWEKMDSVEKEEVLARSRQYTLLYLFVYEENEIFDKYELRRKEIRQYMIDFRNISTIRCDMIKRAEYMGTEDLPILESKCLQLSDKVREELREKMAYYYSRPVEKEEIGIMI